MPPGRRQLGTRCPGKGPHASDENSCAGHIGLSDAGNFWRVSTEHGNTILHRALEDSFSHARAPIRAPDPPDSATDQQTELQATPALLWASVSLLSPRRPHRDGPPGARTKAPAAGAHLVPVPQARTARAGPPTVRAPGLGREGKVIAAPWTDAQHLTPREQKCSTGESSAENQGWLPGGGHTRAGPNPA